MSDIGVVAKDSNGVSLLALQLRTVSLAIK